MKTHANKGCFCSVGVALDPHPSFHPAGPTFTLRLALMGSPAVHPALGEDAGLISQAGGHTEDVTVTCGHILFSGCTCALFLLNSQSFIDSKPLPFSPTLSTLYFFAMYPPFPPLNHSSAFTSSISSTWSLFSQKKTIHSNFFLPRTI